MIKKDKSKTTSFGFEKVTPEEKTEKVKNVLTLWQQTMI